MTRKTETVADAVRRLLPDGAVYDCALPQSFVDDMRHRVGAEPCGSFVWVYDHAAPVFGRPLPLTYGGACALADYNKAAGTEYPVPAYNPED